MELLYEQGVPPPTQVGRVSGKKPERFKGGLQLWGWATIKRILHNPIYRGVSYRSCWVKRGKSYVFDPDNPKAIWVEDAHEKIVTQELWEAAHRQVAKLTAKRNTNLHMLTGLLVCPLCGNTFGFEVSKDRHGNRNAYYVCRSKRGKTDEFGRRRRAGDACPARYLPLEKTDKLVWDAFVRLISSPEMVEQYLSSSDAEKRRRRLEGEIRQLEREAARIDDMMARARRKMLEEILTDGEYLKERERLETQLKGIQRRQQTKETELKSSSKNASMQVIHNLAILKLGEKKLSREQRSRLFHSIVRRVVPKDMKMKAVEIELYVQPEESSLAAPEERRMGEQKREPGIVTMPLPVSA